MEPVNITICGTPSPQTLTDLFAIAMRDGLGFVLPPRLLAAVVEQSPVAPKKLRGRTAAAQPRPRQVEIIQAKAAALTARMSEVAAERRDAVVAQLRRAGDVGLSFKGLLNAARAALLTAGDNDQQVSALRNALTTLQRDGRVKRVAGQWMACD